MDLSDLAQTHGVSGDEHEVRDLLAISAKALCDELLCDSMGNLIGVKGKDRPGPRVMLAAHIDEPGLIVSAIHESGLLRCKKVGDLDESALFGVHVAVGKDKVTGIIGGKPVHLLQSDERRKMPKVDNVYIDIGAAGKKEAEALVSVGDYAAFATQYAVLGNNMAKGKALGARGSAYALLQALACDTPFPLYGAFTVQKEVRMRGARIAAYRINPQIALVLDAAPAMDVPGVPEGQPCVRLGAGPAFTVMDQSSVTDAALTRWLARIAAKEHIAFQWQECASAAGNAGAVQLAREGVRVAAISFPCRYMGGPVNVVSLSDVDAVVRLVKAALTQLATHASGL